MVIVWLSFIISHLVGCYQLTVYPDEASQKLPWEAYAPPSWPEVTPKLTPSKRKSSNSVFPATFIIHLCRKKLPNHPFSEDFQDQLSKLSRVFPCFSPNFLKISGPKAARRPTTSGTTCVACARPRSTSPCWACTTWRRCHGWRRWARPAAPSTRRSPASRWRWCSSWRRRNRRMPGRRRVDLLKNLVGGCWCWCWFLICLVVVGSMERSTTWLLEHVGTMKRSTTFKHF